VTTSAMRAPFAATAVADWFVELVSDDAEQDLTPLKLQKLVYLAHSLYMDRFHIPLIEDAVQAWKDGPVVKSIYGVYKEFGNAPIALPKRNLQRRSWPDEVEQTFGDVWACFGGYSASKLRSITHEAGPWKDLWNVDSRSVVIPNEAIRDAWAQFEKYAESPLVARTNTTSAALARYSTLLGTLPAQRRHGDMALLDKESKDTESLRQRASTHFG
jgi:uncharacterized phage-associated protein